MDGDPDLSSSDSRTEMERSSQGLDESIPNKKLRLKSGSSSEIKAKEYFSLRAPPSRQKKKGKVKLDVRGLLSTGILEGFPVTYKKDNVELSGFIKDQGYKCGCSLCNFTEVVSALKFESHAKASSNNQNNHIFLESGISLYALVKELGNVDLGSLGEVIEEKIRCRPNMEQFLIWKARSSLQTGEKNQQFQGVELRGNHGSLKSSFTLDKENGFNSASYMNVSSSASASECSMKPDSGINCDATFQGSAIKGSAYPGSDMSAHCLSTEQTSSMMEDRFKWKRSLPRPPTEASITAASSNNFRFNVPGPAAGVSIIPSSTIDLTVSSPRSAREDLTDPGSDMLIDGPPILQKSSMMKTDSERRKNLPKMSHVSNDLIEPADHLVQQKGAGEGGSKKRSGDLHRIIFVENNLPEGAELSYQSKREKVLTGYKSGTGIFCYHCNTVISPSKFEAHAGFAAKRQPYRHIYTSKGISLHELALSLTSCRNSTTLCMICGDGGDLVCCHRCSRAFHIDCLGFPSNPDAAGECYCPQCKDNFRSERASRLRSSGTPVPRRLIEHPMDGCCALCRHAEYDLAEELFEGTIICCGQCEKEYHVGCLKDQCELKEKPRPWFSWLCSAHCASVHVGLQNTVHCGPKIISKTLLNTIKGRTGLSRLSSKDEPADLQWHLVSGKYKTSENMLSFSMAISVFQDAFGPIVEGGHDLIPAMVKGEELAGKDFAGMHCALITVNSAIVSAGLLRVFGRDAAELSLVATPKESRGKGYFQILLALIQLLLVCLKVKLLILPADDDTQSIWINKFGFVKMTEEQVLKCATDHRILRFHNTTMLEKRLAQIES